MNDDTDKILQSNLSNQEIIMALAHLCRHRYKCMEADAELVVLHKRLNANQETVIKNLEQQLKLERQLPLLGRWMTAINNWAKP